VSHHVGHFGSVAVSAAGRGQGLQVGPEDPHDDGAQLFVLTTEAAHLLHAGLQSAGKKIKIFLKI
jgi:hypothetical protein